VYGRRGTNLWENLQKVLSLHIDTEVLVDWSGNSLRHQDEFYWSIQDGSLWLEGVLRNRVEEEAIVFCLNNTYSLFNDVIMEIK
jgi:hypothetical protein